MMVVVAVVAIWLFIIVEAITYHARHSDGQSAWDSSR
jgi:hypothetical protein